MMKFQPIPLALLALVAACDSSQPLIFDGQDELGPVDEAAEVTEEETSGSDPATSAVPPTIDELLDENTLPVDLSSARADRGDIARTEARDGSGGFAEEFLFDVDDDTLTIDNLAFDGLNVYTRGSAVPAAQDGPRLSDLGTIAVYHADITTPDFLTDAPIDQQDPYVALYDESDTIVVADIPADATPEERQAILDAAAPRTRFTVVRTGAYVGYGFGGFGYERAGDVVLASTGQATFSGDYAGLRVLDQYPEMLVIEGDVSIDIDFDDFNSGAGLKGEITNKQAYLADGTIYPTTNRENSSRITAAEQTILDAQRAALTGSDIYQNETNNEAYEGTVQLPDVNFVVRGGGETIKGNGEISGEVRSRYINPQSGQTEVYDEGAYFAIIAGDTTTPTGGEVVGIVKTEAPDSRFLGVNAQETGGFIAGRTQ